MRRSGSRLATIGRDRWHDGATINPGDIIVGDQEGLLAFHSAQALAVIEKAIAQYRKEEATIQAIREGRWDRSFVDALEARGMN